MVRRQRRIVSFLLLFLPHPASSWLYFAPICCCVYISSKSNNQNQACGSEFPRQWCRCLNPWYELMVFGAWCPRWYSRQPGMMMCIPSRRCRVIMMPSLSSAILSHHGTRSSNVSARWQISHHRLSVLLWRGGRQVEALSMWFLHCVGDDARRSVSRSQFQFVECTMCSCWWASVQYDTSL